MEVANIPITKAPLSASVVPKFLSVSPRPPKKFLDSFGPPKPGTPPPPPSFFGMNLPKYPLRESVNPPNMFLTPPRRFPFMCFMKSELKRFDINPNEVCKA